MSVCSVVGTEVDDCLHLLQLSKAFLNHITYLRRRESCLNPSRWSRNQFSAASSLVELVSWILEWSDRVCVCVWWRVTWMRISAMWRPRTHQRKRFSDGGSSVGLLRIARGGFVSLLISPSDLKLKLSDDPIRFLSFFLSFHFLLASSNVYCLLMIILIITNLENLNGKSMYSFTILSNQTLIWDEVSACLVWR